MVPRYCHLSDVQLFCYNRKLTSQTDEMAGTKNSTLCGHLKSNTRFIVLRVLKLQTRRTPSDSFGHQ